MPLITLVYGPQVWSVYPLFLMYNINSLNGDILGFLNRFLLKCERIKHSHVGNVSLAPIIREE